MSRNTVLYIDKPLKEHNLIQAIARVNRLHPLKVWLADRLGASFPSWIPRSKSIRIWPRAQGGYDINDIAGLYNQMSSEYKRLQLHKNLWAIFSDVKNKGDIEQLRQVLVPGCKSAMVSWLM